MIVWLRAFMLVVDRNDEFGDFDHPTWDTNADDGNILRVYVELDSRGEGIGGRLLEETCQTPFDRGSRGSRRCNPSESNRRRRGPFAASGSRQLVGHDRRPVAAGARTAQTGESSS